MTDRWAIVTARLLFAFLGFSALVTEVVTLVERGRLNLGDFLSYFTVQSNTLAVVALVLSAVLMAAGRTGPKLDFFRGAVTFYMATVMIIFIVLLSGYPASDLTAVPWDNTVLHYVMPVVLIADWLVVGAEPIAPRRALVWLGYPLAYLVYSLVRGPIADFYPYPFMDPDRHGYGGVLLTSLVIAPVLAGLAWAVASVPTWRQRVLPHSRIRSSSLR